MGILQGAEMTGIVKKKRELKSFNYTHSRKHSYLLKETLREGFIILSVGVDEVILDQEIVKILLPHLQKFAETGEL
jgi:hypothetical protein